MLVQFVKFISTYSLSQLQACKAKALELLSEFIEKVDKKILPYAVDIKVNNILVQ